MWLKWPKRERVKISIIYTLPKILTGEEPPNTKLKKIANYLLTLLKNTKKKHQVSLGIAAVILFTVLSPNFIFDLVTPQAEIESEGEFLLGSEETPTDDAPYSLFSAALASPVYFSENSNMSESREGRGGSESDFIIIQNSAIFASYNPQPAPNIEKRQGIITYIVKEGDIPSVIAWDHGISSFTLLWANNLGPYDYIRPGDKLIILPISGVLHKVMKGETLTGIVKKYKGNFEETLKINDLPADGTIQIGQEIVVVDGVKPTPKPLRSYATSYSSKGSHHFPYGYCTWYVAQKRYIPWGGHAKSWLSQAKKYGFATGSTPVVGAIIVTKESWYGHVGYVEAVEGNWVTFSEMNYLGWGIKNVRTLHVSNSIIRGYIY